MRVSTATGNSATARSRTARAVSPSAPKGTGRPSPRDRTTRAASGTRLTLVLGRELAGELGDGSHTERRRPRRISAGTDWATVSVGAILTCGVKKSGSLWCWGDNYYGQIGDGHDDERTRRADTRRHRQQLEVVSANVQRCGVRTDHTLWCWGGSRCAGRQLGNGTTDGHSTPTQVAGTDVVRVSVGRTRRRARAHDRHALVLGANSLGTVGTASGLRTALPHSGRHGHGLDRGFGRVRARLRCARRRAVLLGPELRG